MGHHTWFGGTFTDSEEQAGWQTSSNAFSPTHCTQLVLVAKVLP